MVQKQQMAEGKKLAIHKHGREVELTTVEKQLQIVRGTQTWVSRIRLGLRGVKC